MIKKVVENIVLVLLVSIILVVFVKVLDNDLINRIIAVNMETLFISCLIVGSILVFLVNRVLKFMGEVMYLNSPLSKIDKMSGEEFERYLKLRFQKLGYKVEITPASGDYGADLFCFNKKETIVVQAKRYDGNVGTAAVQEVVGAKDYYEADLCAVITNSYFTVNALNLAEANGVVLIDRDELLNFNFERVHIAV